MAKTAFWKRKVRIFPRPSSPRRFFAPDPSLSLALSRVSRIRLFVHTFAWSGECADRINSRFGFGIWGSWIREGAPLRSRSGSLSVSRCFLAFSPWPTAAPDTLQADALARSLAFRSRPIVGYLITDLLNLPLFILTLRYLGFGDSDSDSFSVSVSFMFQHFFSLSLVVFVIISTSFKYVNLILLD